MELRKGKGKRESPLRSLDEWAQRFLDRKGWLDTLPQVTAKIHVRMSMLHGGKEADGRTRFFMAQTVVRTVIVFVFLHVLGLVSGDFVGFVFGGFFLAVLVPIRAYFDLEKQIKLRRRLIILALPEYVDKLLLLVNAGETVQRAMIRCVSDDVK
ncbi:hypothetical protein [Paenibacillus sp. MBLB4367]|uniref:hypothetical protein n=1 Tax=Paenibacillus sp. MBLB4367 TaxID=3384767 RepID=UPI003907F92A